MSEKSLEQKAPLGVRLRDYLDRLFKLKPEPEEELGRVEELFESVKHDINDLEQGHREAVAMHSAMIKVHDRHVGELDNGEKAAFEVRLAEVKLMVEQRGEALRLRLEELESLKAMHLRILKIIKARKRNEIHDVMLGSLVQTIGGKAYPKIRTEGILSRVEKLEKENGMQEVDESKKG